MILLWLFVQSLTQMQKFSKFVICRCLEFLILNFFSLYDKAWTLQFAQSVTNVT